MTQKAPTAARTPRRPRLPLSDLDREALTTALAKVPREQRTHFDWRSAEGAAFLDLVDEVRRRHVPIPWIADALDVSVAQLANMVGRRMRARLPEQKAKTT